jgi:hypothetical protein
VLAVALALAGIVLGKYLAFVWIGQDVIDEVGFSFSLPIFSTDTVRLFWDSRSDVWGGWDLLWAGLAALTAFRIPQHEHEQPLPETAGATAPSAQPRDDANLS